VGTIEPRKNLRRVLAAIHLLRSRRATADIRLVHAGPEGWLADDVPRAVRELGLSAVVRFLGFVPQSDLVALYRLARVCVYPSLYEGFGLPVAEAMACGCPVVTSDVSSLPEVAGDAAVLVDPTSVEAIADGIASLWTDEARRRSLTTHGLQRAGTFTWERAARETSAVYDAVLS
jgi:glycosyltransferase involved in cell wall biosynthesis